MRSRSTSSDLVHYPERHAAGLPSSFVAVKPGSGRGRGPARARADLIRDVVDAYRRLYGSVQRFVLMLTGEQLQLASVGTSGSHPLNQLLSVLADEAAAAHFAGLRELKAIIEEARGADRLRDAIFSDAFSHDLDALCNVAMELERLDAAFVGLCVRHVLERHAQAPLGIPSDGVVHTNT